MVSPDTPEAQLSQDVATLRQVLSADLDPQQIAGRRPCLVILSGLPGTGKSHLGRELASRLPFLVLESDRLRKALKPQPSYTTEENARLFTGCYQLIIEYLAQGRRVIFDATNLQESHRQSLLDIANYAGAAVVLVRVTAPPPLVRQRLAQRSAAPDTYSDADWQIYCRMKPNEEPIKQRHFTVDTSRNITTMVERILNASAG